MDTKHIYTKTLGEALANEAKSKPNLFHIVPYEADRWAVVKDGSVKASRVFPSQKDAVSFATGRANKLQGGQLVIHNAHGINAERIQLP